MSLHETYSDLSATQAPGPEIPAAAIPPLDPALLQLREALGGVLAIGGETHGEERRSGNRVYVFRGELQVAPEIAFAQVSQRFKPLGFAPMLRREDDEDAVIAIEGEIPQRRFNTHPLAHLALLLITIATTTIMGAALTGLPARETWAALRAWDTAVLWPALRDGLPFSLTLLAILGTHEMGHYIAARLHGVKVTLPFFIPLPIQNSLGTMGAVIFIKSPFMNRRQLFDVGIAGPLAGLALAIPLYMIGVTQQATVGRPITWMQAGILRVSNPPLLDWIGSLVVDTNNLDKLVFFGHPMALAAWFGVLLTGLNLLPLGQFDGGHVAYALLGRRAWSLATFTFVILITMGLFGAWVAWLVWAFMGLLTGLRHPPPYDDLSSLGWARMALGAATAVIFILILVPVPFYAP